MELSLAKNVRGSRWALSEQINPLKGLCSKGVSKIGHGLLAQRVLSVVKIAYSAQSVSSSQTRTNPIFVAKG